jgi:5'-3' exonuclease, N-terminal resolvase-like domain/T4 RNase H, C terminal
MIIIDLSQFLISSVFAQMGGQKNLPVEENLLRHILLNSIRSMKMKYKDYGDVVIACDDKNYWRKQIFPYYKAHRKKAREESDMDWNMIFGCLDKFKIELRENFPYKVIQVPHAEADDIIAVLTKHYHAEGILIASSDKDYQQLQAYPMVKQYSPILKKEIVCANPKQYLLEHIIRGDGGDGVPNCLSADNTFVMGLRQKPVTAKRIDEIMANPDALDGEVKRNFLRNKQLIDFDCIPDYIEAQVIEQFDGQEWGNRSKLFSYFIENKMKNLMESVGDF